MSLRILLSSAMLLASASLAEARMCQGVSDIKIRETIVQESRMAYYRTGHACACPYDLSRNGQECGRRSAYSRPGGARPKCYISDVARADTEAYCLPLASGGF